MSSLGNNNNNRYSTYSNLSNAPQHPHRASQQLPSQVSTQTLLGVLHGAHQQNAPFQLESSTSLVVNTWQAAIPGPDGRSRCIVDADIANKAWEHARRRAEDACVVLTSLHEAAPSTLAPFISALPLSVPSSFFTALATIRPFLECVTPTNHATSRHSALAVTFTLALQTGNVAGAELKLSAGGLDTRNGLVDVPKQDGYRAFDVFYYLLSSASTAAEREALGLKAPSSYTLLRRSGSYAPPSYLPTADDAAAAEDFRANLKAIGVSGPERRGLLSVLAALLKIGDTTDYLVDDNFIENACEEAADLLDLEPQVLLDITTASNSDDRSVLIGALYEALVDWVLVKANEAIAQEIIHGKHASADSESRLGAVTPGTSDDGDTASITILEIPSTKLGKAVALKNVFDDNEGINAEMKEDGVAFPPAGHTIVKEMQEAISHVEPELGILNGSAGRDWELLMDRRSNLLERIGTEITDEECLLKKMLYPLAGQSVALGHYNRCKVADVLGSSRVWFQLSVYPTDKEPAKDQKFEASSPSRQLREWRLPEWANRRNKQLDYTADFDHDEFCSRYARLGCLEGKDGIESFLLERGWSNGEIALGDTRVWVREGVWMEMENMLDMLPQPTDQQQVYGQMAGGAQSNYPPTGSGYFNSPFGDNMTISQDNLAAPGQSAAALSRPRSLAPTQALTMRSVSGGDYGLGNKGDAKDGTISYYNEMDLELAEGKKVEEVPVSTGRRVWVAIVWALTFWIPSPLLRVVGRMKRPDVRMAWREKFVLVFLIFLANAILVFYIIAFGRILCPNYDKAWNIQELSTHQGDNDMFVSVYGRVYDISKFWKIDHSSGEGNLPPVQSSQMQQTAGQDVTPMFPLALETYCSPLVPAGSTVTLQYNNTNALTLSQIFSHASGPITRYTTTSLNDTYWFRDKFLTRMKDYYKGDLVYSKKNVTKEGTDNARAWFTINDQVYDLTDYFYTKKFMSNLPSYSFLDTTLEQMVQNDPGADLTDKYNDWLARNQTAARQNFNCLNNIFYLGKTDYRDTAKCRVNSYILLAFTCLLGAVILVKFLAALQFGSKRKPSPQDKFVICHVPAYTEGEDDLRKGLDSLTALKYDNKRKLLCVVCDGVIVGGGNDRPTPKIVLDILGVDPKIDPPALPFKSVGQGAEQLNYGKVYSGLYEFEGNVVPYIVVVKVGKESEQAKTKPGNRGKRDSQILLMSFLNRVHHRSAMSPLELEMFHQINNIIGVDPELYEYVFMVDADTMVQETALTKLVAACADDSKIAGICGETSLRNEERSWTTMIQVYEYYISHHLAKAFESLFGSVTCLPGCFCMYRLRTADKGKPLLISDKVINEYSDCNVDTLHKKNLLSLGEDRYLTTLMTKHFPFMRYKFVPDAFAQTAAPESWSVLLSQRRRWINSTIHNLAELVWIKDMCGFCCFSMRFVVFIDLFGTIMLPATCTYLVYLIVIAATGKSQFPILSIVIIAAVYGLQAVIFIMKRQWQHIGWMIIYIAAFPIYSLILPVYSFWKQDDFSWGNTRVVIGEKGNKQLVAVDDEGFDPRSIPLQPWDDYAMQNNLPGRRGHAVSEKGGAGYEDGYEMDDMRSVYSAQRPASTVLTGFRSQQPGNFYMAPNSPAPLATGRQSVMRQSQSNFQFPYQDQPSPGHDANSRLMGNFNDQQHSPYGRQSPAYRSSENLMMRQSNTGTPLNRAGRQSPMPFANSRPASTINFQQAMGHGEASDVVITEAIQECLATVDLDNVTKKSLKALVEQRLHMQLSNERRAFLDRQIDHELANM